MYCSVSKAEKNQIFINTIGAQVVIVDGDAVGALG